MIKKVKVDLDFDIFLMADFSMHTGTCIKHQVHELQDIHEQYGGFPESYTSANTVIHQVWFDNARVDYGNIGIQLGIEPVTVSAIKQPPGCVIPLHRDTFYQTKIKYPNDSRKIVRANIFLEYSQIGHIIQYIQSDVIHSVTEWSAGEGYMWDNEIVHLGANAGMTPKFTLQVTGFLL